MLMLPSCYMNSRGLCALHQTCFAQGLPEVSCLAAASQPSLLMEKISFKGDGEAGRERKTAQPLHAIANPLDKGREQTSRKTRQIWLFTLLLTLVSAPLLVSREL